MLDTIEDKLDGPEQEIIKELKDLQAHNAEFFKKTLNLIFKKKPDLTFLKVEFSLARSSISFGESILSLDQVIEKRIEKIKDNKNLNPYNAKSYMIDDKRTSIKEVIFPFTYHIIQNDEHSAIVLSNFEWKIIKPGSRNRLKKDVYDLFFLCNKSLTSVLLGTSFFDYPYTLGNCFIFDRSLDLFDPRLVIRPT